MAEERYPLWEAVHQALALARAKYARRLAHRCADEDLALAELRETTVNVQLKPGLHQHLTFTFHHRVTPRSFIYYYTLRRQTNDTYRIIDVEKESVL